jgi:hypothetical protein
MTVVCCRVVREFNLPDSFSSVLQRAMEGGAGTDDIAFSRFFSAWGSADSRKAWDIVYFSLGVYVLDISPPPPGRGLLG